MYFNVKTFILNSLSLVKQNSLSLYICFFSLSFCCPCCKTHDDLIPCYLYIGASIYLVYLLRVCPYFYDYKWWCCAGSRWPDPPKPSNLTPPMIDEPNTCLYKPLCQHFSVCTQTILNTSGFVVMLIPEAGPTSDQMSPQCARGLSIPSSHTPN